MTSPDWSGASGDIWAMRWRDTDRALAGIGVRLDEAIARVAPDHAFKALDVGCGPGTSSLELARARPDAAIIACDVSAPLIQIARERAGSLGNVEFVVADAEDAARSHGPFEIIFSRHGVMFFDDPRRAFRVLRDASASGGHIVFSCFRAWDANPWASDLASAAAGQPVAPPGREPSGFAFADPDYVRDILSHAGWIEVEPQPVDFLYVAGEGPDASEQALDFFSALGPASRILENLARDSRQSAVERMRGAIDGHRRGDRVTFSAAAWIWKATAR